MTTPTIATNPLYQHFAPNHQIEDEQQQKSVLLELVNDTKNIAQVFPLMNQSGSSSLKPEPHQPISRTLPPIRQQQQQQQQNIEEQQCLINNNSQNSPSHNISYSTYESDGKENLSAAVIRHPLSLNVAKYERNPAYNSRSGSFNVQYPVTPAGINSQPITPSSHSKAPVTPFLSVQPQAPYRAVSAELLAPHDDSDLRRKSFDNLSNAYRRPPGQQRRLLPSTEHLEKQKSEDVSFV
uniref:Uncharacterized protein n=1 Tax=Panagrolaimus sp. ES5 TaxID=591445 RepID=A0AC34GVY0_9BILA